MKTLYRMTLRRMPLRRKIDNHGLNFTLPFTLIFCPNWKV
jgi:hypothetical protein